MLQHRPLAFAAALLCASAFAGAASAQQGPAHGAHGMASPGHGMMREGHGDMAGHLRAILQLKPQQEPALKAYLEALKPAPMTAPPLSGEMTTLRRLDGMAAHMAAHEARMKAMIEATRRFYAALEPGQQRAFDALMEMHGAGMPMIMMGHPPMGPGMGLGTGPHMGPHGAPPAG